MLTVVQHFKDFLSECPCRDNFCGERRKTQQNNLKRFKSHDTTPKIQPVVNDCCQLTSCNIGHRIFVIGATKDRCDVFNTLSEKWSHFDAKFPHPFTTEMTMITLQKRFIYTIRGAGIPRNMDLICRLDTVTPAKGWLMLNVKNPILSTGGNYGVISLG